jgi:hypothetical protein
VAATKKKHAQNQKISIQVEMEILDARLRLLELEVLGLGVDENSGQDPAVKIRGGKSIFERWVRCCCHG